MKHRVVSICALSRTSLLVNSKG